MALALVASLVLWNQALVQPSLMRLTTDAPLINIAGRQRMLSQRLSKTALALDRFGAKQGEAYLQELKEVRELWAASHEHLRRADPGPPWFGHAGRDVREGLDRIEPPFFRMKDAADRLIRAGAGEGSAQDRGDLAIILANEAEYLRGMEQLVGLYERQAREHVERLRWIGWGMAAATLAALAAIGRWILWPAVVLIRRQVAELAEARDDLEARVRERTRELAEARNRHQELLDQVSHVGRASTIGEMASGLAHELNQPLGAIANYAEGCLIVLDEPAPDLAEVRGALGRLRASALRAGQILDRIRRFVTRQEPNREPIDPERVAREAAEILSGEAERLGITLKLDLAQALPCPIGDPIQILQVLVNLLRNALDSLKASQPETAEVVLWTRRSESRGVEFGVTDTGEGIASDRIDRIFDAYSSTRADGMGMGLAICRTIAEAHQTRILVESEPGIRTTFRFTLPATDGDDDAGPDGLHCR